MSVTESSLTLVKGHILNFQSDPAPSGAHQAKVDSLPAGAVLLQDGQIAALGDAPTLEAAIAPDTRVIDYGGDFIIPGFIDLHNHYPQTEIIGSYSGDLLHWLHTYTFPEELRFSDAEHAARIAQRYMQLLISNGTTSAMSFCSSHPTSVDALLSEAASRDMRFYAGKVMMDREAPDALCDTAATSYAESRELITRWHGQGRLTYVVTPRFAITSTPEQLEAAASLIAEFPELKLQSHLSENPNEIAHVLSLYPDAEHYTDIYLKAGLLGSQCFYGHGIYLSEPEWQILHDTGTTIVHCPTSNNFLGSGLFDLKAANDAERPVKVGLATDTGGGSSFSMLATMKAAYEVARLKGNALDPVKAFWMATRGNALTLDPNATFGALEAGYEADFCVLSANEHPILQQRVDTAESLSDILFSFMMFGDDRCVRSTWIAGKCAHDRDLTISDAQG